MKVTSTSLIVEKFTMTAKDAFIRTTGLEQIEIFERTLRLDSIKSRFPRDTAMRTQTGINKLIQSPDDLRSCDFAAPPEFARFRHSKPTKPSQRVWSHRMQVLHTRRRSHEPWFKGKGLIYIKLIPDSNGNFRNIARDNSIIMIDSGPEWSITKLTAIIS